MTQPTVDIEEIRQALAQPGWGGTALVAANAREWLEELVDELERISGLAVVALNELAELGSVAGREKGVPPDSPYRIFDHCPQCNGDMRAEHAHYRCSSCGWRDSCCD